MGLRDWFQERRSVDGQSVEGVAALRAASLNLYGNGFGASDGFTSYVPPLTFNSKKTNVSESSTENPLLLGPMWRISFRMGALALKVFKIDPKTGERFEDPTHPAYKMLRHPNDILNRPLLISGTVMSMMEFGAAYWFKTRDKNGKIIEVWPVPAPRVRVVRSDTKLIDHFELTQTTGTDAGRTVNISLEDMCYFRLMPDPRTWSGAMSPVQALGEIADYSSSALETSTEFFEKNILGRVYINMNGKELSPAGRRRLAAQMEIARRDRFGVPVMEDGATLENMGTPPDPKMLSGAIETAHLLTNQTLGLPEPGSKDWERLYYGEVIQPIADAVEQELERSFMTEWPNKPAFPEFQFREVLAGDPLQRAQLHHIKILSGQETLDEARKDENKAPLPDHAGEQAFLPLNLMPVDMMGKEVGVSNTPHLPKNLDTKGGTGGSDGKGTRPKGGKTPVGNPLANADNSGEASFITPGKG